MSVSVHFKETIKSYLEKKAEKDSLFAVTYAKEKKNIDDCCTYILNRVEKSGCRGFTDPEIFSMAVHYYDEDNIDVGNPINYNAVVNHVVELTDEEKEEARDNAKAEYENKVRKELKEQADRIGRKKQSQPAEQSKEPIQLSLF